MSFPASSQKQLPTLASERFPMAPEPRKIRRVVQETHDSFTLSLEPSVTPFAPGQFNMLYLFGKGEVPISISGDPAKPEVLVHTVRAVGAVTKAMALLKRGDTVGVRGPYGTSWPVDAARGKDLVVVAGGIGMAPLRPVIYSVLRQRADFGRVHLLYGTRTPADILFDDELKKWRSRFDLEIEVTVDQGQRPWRGRTGVVTTLIARADFDPENTVAVVCGPEIMMRFAARELGNQGVPRSHIYVSLERNMQCAVAHCGHCQLGSELICRDGPIYALDRVAHLMTAKEL